MDDRRAEKALEQAEDDLFDDAFGVDEEEKKAKAERQRLLAERHKIAQAEEKAKADALADEHVPTVPDSSSSESPVVPATRSFAPPAEKQKPKRTIAQPKVAMENSPPSFSSESASLDPVPLDKPKEPKPAVPKKPRALSIKPKPLATLAPDVRDPQLHETIRRTILAKAQSAAESEKHSKAPARRPEDVESGTIEDASNDEVVPEEAPKSVEDKDPLDFLNFEEGVFIGRKKSVFEKFGKEASLYLGAVEEESQRDKRIFLDGLNPHVVFVCGARGSGKSYVLGILAEELALKNKHVGVVVVDPIGVFWSMRFPNRDERELRLLAKWDLMPQGLDNLKVFIPEGMKENVPPSTYDATFAIQPSLLTTEDWCLTFGIERFSPSGLLLEKTLSLVKGGHTSKDGVKIKPAGMNYSLDNIIFCLENDAELNSAERGYKPDSIRALVSRIDAAKAWGIFSQHGTPLSELSSEGQLTILDTSLLEESTSALVIGLLARRILQARKMSTRKEAVKRMDTEDADEFLESEIPPTWLFIDEAHTLIPSGNTRTPASKALVEYVKQGRQPGCSLVFATQQPSAIDTRVLSQLDIFMSYKLVFDDDIKAVFKRIPTRVPVRYRSANFIRSLPVGTALAGDRREETTRAFTMRVRPRMSQHEGREAETVGQKIEISPEQSEKLAVEMIHSKLQVAHAMDQKQVAQIVDALSKKYHQPINPSRVVSKLEKKGVVVDPKTKALSIPVDEPELEEEIVSEPKKEILKEAKRIEESPHVELLAVEPRLDEKKARELANKIRKKRFLGFFGDEEIIDRLELKYLPVYHFKFKVSTDRNSFRLTDAYFDSYSGELIRFDAHNHRIVKSTGLFRLSTLSADEIRLLSHLTPRNQTVDALAKELETDADNVKTLAENLGNQRLARGKTEKGQWYLRLSDEIVAANELDAADTLLIDPFSTAIGSFGQLPLVEETAMNLQREVVAKEDVVQATQNLWPNASVVEIKTVYLPFYDVILKKPNGTERRMWVEAVTGNEIPLSTPSP